MSGPVDGAEDTVGDGGHGKWRERLVAALHLFTSLALSPLHLLPATLLVLMVGSVSATMAEILLGIMPLDAELPALVGMTLVALPVATLLARLGSRIQKARLGDLFGIGQGTAPEPEEAPALVRGLRFLLGREAWTAVLYSTITGLVGLLFGGLAALLVAYGIGGMIGGALAFALMALSGLTVQTGSLATALLPLLLGPPLVLGGLWLGPRLVRVDIRIAQRMLFDSPQVRVRRRMLYLRDTRSRMVDAAEAERRRIERDLHDGAQQRLLALSMLLTRAHAKFDQDPDQVRALLDEARGESRAVMADLREVARGLHPRVLTDHGLGAALPGAAGRCPVPVRVEVELDERPSPRAEGVAYYVACEALTNVAKHAQAASVTVRAECVPRRRGDLLRITVTDDGRGGADPDAGTGLDGLSDRVHAVDGELFVQSPSGGGTVLTADIPWKA